MLKRSILVWTTTLCYVPLNITVPQTNKASQALLGTPTLPYRQTISYTSDNMIPFEEASPSIAPEVALMSILVRGVPSNTTCKGEPILNALMSILVRGVPSNTTCKGEPILNISHKQVFSIHFEEETVYNTHQYVSLKYNRGILWNGESLNWYTLAESDPDSFISALAVAKK